MKKLGLGILIGVVSVMVLFSAGSVRAQFGLGVRAGIGPASPFYVFDRWGERIGMFFAFSPEKKAQRAMKYAEEKLAETESMVEKRRSEETTVASKGYQDYLDVADTEIKKVKQKGKPTEDVSSRVADSTMKHIEVLEKVIDKAPEQAKESITKAKEKSMTGQENALRALAEENPGKAAKINLKAIDSKLKKAKFKAERGEIEKVKEAAQEFERHYKLGEEISETAKKVGKDETKVEELVGKATSHHVEVLSDVYQKVPQEAKKAIEKSMTESVTGYKKAMTEVLKKKMKKAKEEDVEKEIEKVRQALPEPVFDKKVPKRIREKVMREAEERLKEKEKKRAKPEKETKKERKKKEKEKCAYYVRQGKKEKHCALCGDGVCEPIEGCVPFVTKGKMTTTDCGPLYCPEDCKEGFPTGEVEPELEIEKPEVEKPEPPGVKEPKPKPGVELRGQNRKRR